MTKIFRDEQADSDRLESLVGGPDRAFRLMRLWTSAQQSASGNRFTMSKRPTASEIFTASALRDGYSKQAIRFYTSDAFQ